MFIIAFIYFKVITTYIIDLNTRNFFQNRENDECEKNLLINHGSKYSLRSTIPELFIPILSMQNEYLFKLFIPNTSRFHSQN